MIILAVDAGNTRIKWGLHDGSAWKATGAVPHADRDQLAAAWSGLDAPERIVVSNVAGDRAGSFLRGGFGDWDAEQLWVRSRAEQCGVRNAYLDPGQLGSDRWASLIAARRLEAGPCLVVTAGTALTVDALSGGGCFLGGIIVPGVGLMKRALAGNTAGLREEPGAVQDFPRSTADAIESGAVQALAGAVERMAALLAARSRAAPAC
ncbi:MAG TPA: type III pantothenate kinase, partial [Burkholderiales bacterium]|nr:type III pantothenate kinase [Burkholderiales bacterium]